MASPRRKSEAELAAEARKWLQDNIGIDVENDFFAALEDGVLLCSIVNMIAPGTIKKINPKGRAKKFPAKRNENINNFKLGAQKIGLLKSHLFDVQEFMERKRPDKVVTCLLYLKTKAIAAGVDRQGSAMDLMAEVEASQQQTSGAGFVALTQDDERERREAEEKVLREAEEREQKLYDEAVARRRAEENAALRKLQEEEEIERKRHAMETERAMSMNAAERSAYEATESARRAEWEKRKQEATQKAEEERRAREASEAKAKQERDERMKEMRAKAEADRAARLAGAAAASSASGGGARPVATVTVTTRMLSGPDALLDWCKTSCSSKGVEVSNFTTSWKDGLAMVALVHRYFPSELDWDVLKTKSPAERLEAAMDAASRHGAPPLMDPEDICDVPTPDRKCMMTQLSMLHKAFTGDKK